MSLLDILIVILIIWGGWSGFRRGLITEVCRTGAAVVALALAYRYSSLLATSVAVQLSIGRGAAQVLTFAVILLGVAGIGYAVEPWVHRATQSFRGGPKVEQWGGAVTGVIKAGLMTVVLVVAAAQLPWPPSQRAIGDSLLAIHALQAAPAIYGTIRAITPVEQEVPPYGSYPVH